MSPTIAIFLALNYFFVGHKFCTLMVATKYWQRLAIGDVYQQFIKSVSQIGIFYFQKGKCLHNHMYALIRMLSLKYEHHKIIEKSYFTYRPYKTFLYRDGWKYCHFAFFNYYFVGYQFCKLMVSAKYWQRLANRHVYHKFIKLISQRNIFCFQKEKCLQMPINAFIGIL